MAKKSAKPRDEESSDAAQELQLNLPCRFGSGGMPSGKVGIGVAFEREHLPLGKADALLVNRELSVRLLGGKAADEDPNQTTFIPDENVPEIHATGTCKGMGVKSKWITIRLTFLDTDVDGEVLKALRARRGRFLLEFSSAIPEPEKKRRGRKARATA